MFFDIRDIPFSRYGSYFVFSKDSSTGELLLRDVSGGDLASSTLFKLEAIKNGEVVEYGIEASETELTLYSVEDSKDRVNICIGDERVIHIEGFGLGIRFKAVKSKYDHVVEYDSSLWEYHFYLKELKLMVALLKGKIEVNAPWALIGNESITMDIEVVNGYMHFVIESYKTIWEPKDYESYEKSHERVVECYKSWYESMLMVSGEYEGSRKLASYITWSCVVHPKDKLTRYVMFMSNNWMNNIWSWDNCFNAMMLSKSHPQLALDQFLIFADHQDASGIYPDFINDMYCSFSCTKPPIHAWAFNKLRKNNDFFNNKDILGIIYKSLASSTEYWLKYRRKNAEKLPFYKHGNDSGWDNASVFHHGVPVVSPDLSAYLIKQMDILSDMAYELEKDIEGDRWKREADKMYELLMKKLWNVDEFIALCGLNEQEIPNKTSLLLKLPIVIGYRLPEEIKEKLIVSIREAFECKYGLATEAIGSSLYMDNGYWLGPMWAPVMYLIIDALRDSGYSKLAEDYAIRFCDATLVGGMAENFDPHTGKGLVDPAFTWTSSVFLMLANEYCLRK